MKGRPLNCQQDFPTNSITLEKLSIPYHHRENRDQGYWELKKLTLLGLNKIMRATTIDKYLHRRASNVSDEANHMVREATS